MFEVGFQAIDGASHCLCNPLWFFTFPMQALIEPIPMFPATWMELVILCYFTEEVMNAWLRLLDSKILVSKWTGLQEVCTAVWALGWLIE